MTEQADLREYLRSRRARITPADAGLPPLGGQRRVPGLRREEVALLAGVSADYYERLERGRAKNVSASVLDAVARVLRLDATERAHLYALAHPGPARRASLPPQRVRPGLRRTLDAINDVPALILGRRSDVLAANALARAFYTDFDALPAGERNIVRFLFTDDAARELYDDWAATARQVVASLRVYAGTHPNDPRLAALVGDLSVRDPISVAGGQITMSTVVNTAPSVITIRSSANWNWVTRHSSRPVSPILCSASTLSNPVLLRRTHFACSRVGLCEKETFQRGNEPSPVCLDSTAHLPGSGYTVRGGCL